ncbi:MAG: carbohydrate kinase family protein [Thermomicrobiales bacterium]
MTSEGRFDLITTGNALVDTVHRVAMLPRCDGSALVLDRRVSAGGVEGNVASAAARLGLRVGVIASIGGDPGGDLVLRSFREHGVDTRHIQVLPHEETGYSLVFVDPEGERVIMTGGRGVFGLTLGDAQLAYLRQARVLFASAYASLPVLRALSSVASEPGGPALVFDLPAELEDLIPRGVDRPDIDALLPHVTLFTANRESLRSYTGTDTIADGIEALWRRGVRRGSVSDGKHGLTLFEPDQSGSDARTFHVPAPRVAVVDTTGAGDVLHAALMTAWLIEGRSMIDAGRFAAAAAALTCQGWGVQSALPSRAAAEALARKTID